MLACHWFRSSILIALAALGPTPMQEQALPEGAECLSLGGQPLHPPELPADVRAAREQALEQARALLREDPSSADALIWVGRRLGYLGRYREALAVFEDGLEQHPGDPRFPRHVGHRAISLRAFARAEEQLERAAQLAEGRPDEIEPAGLPNAAGIEIDWLQHSIWYHLALARFLQADWPGAVEGFRRTLELSRNDDARCSAAHWLYVSLRRWGKDAEAAELIAGLPADMRIVEYQAYHELTELYAGRLKRSEVLARARAAGGVQFATRANGVAEWLHAEGREEEAARLWRQIRSGSNWAAFGHIAAEAELQRQADWSLDSFQFRRRRIRALSADQVAPDPALQDGGLFGVVMEETGKEGEGGQRMVYALRDGTAYDHDSWSLPVKELKGHPEVELAVRDLLRLSVPLAAETPSVQALPEASPELLRLSFLTEEGTRSIDLGWSDLLNRDGDYEPLLEAFAVLSLAIDDEYEGRWRGRTAGEYEYTNALLTAMGRGKGGSVTLRFGESLPDPCESTDVARDLEWLRGEDFDLGGLSAAAVAEILLSEATFGPRGQAGNGHIEASLVDSEGNRTPIVFRLRVRGQKLTVTRVDD